MRNAVVAAGLILLLLTSAAPAKVAAHWIDEVTNDGSVVILEDDTIWLVDRMDRLDSSLWLTTDGIEVLATREKGRYRLVNVNQKEVVDAQYLGRK